jgi:hypothetical protein
VYEKPSHGKELAVILRKRWTQERLSRCVEACLLNRELDVVITDGKVPIPFFFQAHVCASPSLSVLSHLIAASSKVNVYGAVQRDIPCILGMFLSFFQAVEDYAYESGGGAGGRSVMLC